MSSADTIVIRGTNWLGDTVITIPAVRAVRELFPRASLTMLAPYNLADLWRNEPAVDDVIGFARPTVLREKVGVIRHLRARRFDLGILFPNSFESALWLFLGGVRRRLGYATCGRGMLLTEKIPEPREGGHQVHRYLHLVRSLGDYKVAATPSIRVPDSLRSWAGELLRKRGIANGAPLVGINPGSTYGSAKCWPTERFVELIRMLIERRGASVMVVGGERSLADSVCRGFGGVVINMAGLTTVMELAALIERCRVFVTNDTGPMHLACAVSVPVAAIIGPTDPEATGPLGTAAIIRKDVACAPCLRRECPTDHQCMTLIGVEEVYQAVRGMLTS